MKKTYILPLLLGVLLTSCNDFLGIKPKGSLIPEKDQDFEYMLNYAQLLKTGESYPAFLTDDAYLPYESQNMISQGFVGADQSTKNAYSFQPDIFGASDDDGLWVYSYQRIYYYNTIINWADGEEELTDKGKVIKAEALTGRALDYLYLVNGYGKHYDPATASSDLAVPLITEALATQESKPRATVQEVYDLIISDLTEAVPLLPNRPVLNSFRASKPAAMGVLARAYLYMGNYEEALKYANQTLEINSALLDYKTLTVNPQMLGLSMVDMPQTLDNPESIYARTAPYSFGNAFSVFPSASLEAIYDKENDLRWQHEFDHSSQIYYSSPEAIYMPGWEINLGIATPEMYLIAAECEARIGNPQRALDLLNTLRDNRIVGVEPIQTSDKAEILRLVLLERRREYAEVGMFRLIDLKRLAKDPANAVTFTRELNGESWTIVPGDPRLVLPIPRNVMAKNPLLVQNER